MNKRMHRIAGCPCWLRQQFLMAFMAALLGVLLAGCGSEVAEDWMPSGPWQGIHPFGEPRNHDEYLVETDYDFSQCTECHGEHLMGEDLGDEDGNVRDCTRCHRPDAHRVFFDDASTHPEYLEAGNYTAVDSCFSCHSASPGAQQPEVVFGGSCGQGGVCHPAEGNGVLSCNTCHGEMDEDPSDPENWAPDTGAHTAHMNVNDARFAEFTCDACHHIPRAWDDAGHFEDDTPGEAELTFDFPADARGFSPDYNEETGTCSVYCHQGESPAWEAEDVLLSCADCHSYPPPPPHVDSINCGTCHDAVVGPNNFTIINPALHANGQLNFH